VITQIVYAELDGDKVICSAYSNELPRYGLNVGLKNYSAAYCTGLLCARRLLQKLGLDEAYQGNEEVDAEVAHTEMNGRKYYVAELDDDKRPFRALLDVGIHRTTTGARVFGALKGAADGGLDVPHTEKRFPGYDRDCKEYDAEVHRERIFGEHIAEFMRKLIDEDSAKYNTQFSRYIKHGAGPEELEDLYTEVHAAIRKDPTAAPKNAAETYDKKFKNTARLTYEERKAAVAAKKAAHAAAEEEEEEEEGADY